MTSQINSAALRGRVGVVGAGRLGIALADGLRAAGIEVSGPAGRDEIPVGEVIVLCVPDAEIAAAAAAVAGTARFVGHTSGATALSVLEPAQAEAFGLHPLQTFPEGAGPEDFAGAGCAVAGATTDALEVASELARALGMRPFEIDDEHRAAYHAAASIASNFLVTLEHAAEQVATGAGLEPAEARALLAPLVRSTVENWSSSDPKSTLTGPIARGDEETVVRQREAVGETAPHLLPLFDELVERTRELAQVPA